MASNTQTVTDRRGNRSVHTFDADGNITQVVNPLGQTTRYTFDANGNQTSRTVTKTIGGAQQSLTTTSTFDAENRLIAETDPLGETRTMVYNSAGKLTSQTNALGQKTTYTYDANARLIATQYPDGTTESTTYDAQGNETSKTDRAGRVTRMEFDALNRLVKTTYPVLAFARFWNSGIICDRRSANFLAIDLPFFLQLLKVLVIQMVGNRNHHVVPTFVAGLIATNQQNRCTARIERIQSSQRTSGVLRS